MNPETSAKLVVAIAGFLLGCFVMIGVFRAKRKPDTADQIWYVETRDYPKIIKLRANSRLAAGVYANLPTTAWSEEEWKKTQKALNGFELKGYKPKEIEDRTVPP